MLFAAAAIGWIIAGIMPLTSSAFWPVSAGDMVWHQHAVTFAADPISPLRIAGHTWVVQPWISAIMWLGAWRVGGMALLSAIGMAVSAGIVVQMVRLARAHARTGAACSAAAIALILMMPLTLRAELLAIALALTLRIELESERRWLWSAPALIIMWTNVHGSFPIAIGMCGAATLGMIRGARIARVAWGRRMLWLLACGCATSVSPLGIGTWSYVHRVSSVPAIAELTPLWQSMRLMSVDGVVLLVCTLVIGSAAIRRLITGRWHMSAVKDSLPAVPVLVLAGASWMVQRNIVWFAVIMAPELARVLSHRHPVHVSRFERLPGGVGVILLGALACGCVAMLPWLPVQHRFAGRSLPPDGALHQVSASDTVYASAEWANYIRLIRGARVVMDARLERFTPADLHAYEQSVRDGVCSPRTPCANGWTIAVLRTGSAARLVQRFKQGGCMVERVGSGSAQAAIIRPGTCANVSGNEGSP